MKRPVIAITTNFTSKELEGNPVSAYSSAIEGAGGSAILIPRDIPVKSYPSLREEYDGVLLSGGGDVDIHLFSGEENPAIGKPSPQRDRLEITLAKMAVESGWPLFGICRGVQVLKVALGGGLITDIPSQYKTSIQHATPAEAGRQFLTHQVNIEKKSFLYLIIQQEEILVNSFHHQAIKDPAERLVVTTRASDGLVEAVELQGIEKPIFGLQWHPENLQHIKAHKALFEAFVESCR